MFESSEATKLTLCSNGLRLNIYICEHWLCVVPFCRYVHYMLFRRVFLFICLIGAKLKIFFINVRKLDVTGQWWRVQPSRRGTRGTVGREHQA